MSDLPREKIESMRRAPFTLGGWSDDDWRALCDMALEKWNAECERDQERERAEEAEREVEKFRAMVKHLKYERDRARQAWDRSEAEIENWRGCYETKKSQIRSLENKVQELERTLEAEQVNSALLSRKLKKIENKE